MNAYRRGLIISIIVISIIIAGRVLEEQKSYGSDQFVEALNRTTFTIESAEINLFGEYIPKYMTKNEMEIMVKMIGDRIGIKDYNEHLIEDENSITYQLDKEAIAANTHIKMVEKTELVEAGTYIARNYLSVNIKLFDKCHSISYFDNLTSKAFAELDIEPSKTLNIVASCKGKMTDEEAKQIMIEVIKSMNGEVRSIYINDAYLTAYGYSKSMKDYVMSKGEKINMDLAVTYDEENNETFLYAATPVITLDY